MVENASRAGIGTLAITDHDTVEGYGLARDAAEAAGIELLCGVELSTHLAGCSRSVHLLGYFAGEAPAGLQTWLGELQESRRRRNAALLERLQELGLDIAWSEVCALARRQVGRPHFAAVLVAKGYAGSLKEAFDVYLGEGARAWVDRDEPGLGEALERLRKAGAFTSLAHPVRISRDWTVRDWAAIEEAIAACAEQGLDAVECFHSEHTAGDTQRLEELARRYGLNRTGGSDFHGDAKPEVQMGTGRGGNVAVPASVMEPMAERFARWERRETKAAGREHDEEAALR